jgi:hypothetical protein
VQGGGHYGLGDLNMITKMNKQANYFPYKVNSNAMSKFPIEPNVGEFNMFITTSPIHYGDIVN